MTKSWPWPNKGSKPRKYKNIPIVLDGIKFQSKAEARRWSELKLLERAGKISALERQVAFPLIVSGEKIGKYIADFVYWAKGANQRTVEDVKSPQTASMRHFQRTRKLVKAIYGIDIEVVR